MSGRRTFTCPVPVVVPFGFEVTPAIVQEVWDTLVKPDQVRELPQSVEMRCLMAILACRLRRAV